METQSICCVHTAGSTILTQQSPPAISAFPVLTQPLSLLNIPCSVLHPHPYANYRNRIATAEKQTICTRVLLHPTSKPQTIPHKKKNTRGRLFFVSRLGVVTSTEPRGGPTHAAPRHSSIRPAVPLRLGRTATPRSRGLPAGDWDCEGGGRTRM